MVKNLAFWIIGLVLVLSLGFAGTAGAYKFEIDWGADGSFDTGGDFALKVCQTVDVDIYFNMEGALDPYIGGFGFGFHGVTIAGDHPDFEILELRTTIGMPLPNTQIFEGGFYAEAGLTGSEPIENIFKIASFKLHCIAPSIDELWIYDWDLQNPVNMILSNYESLDDIVFPQYLGTLVQTPVPGAGLLMVFGVLGLAGLRRKA